MAPHIYPGPPQQQAMYPCKMQGGPDSPGPGKEGEEAPHYPATGPPYAPCSLSPGAQAAWSNNLGAGPPGGHPGYMEQGHPSPQGHGAPAQQAPAQQATPQAPLPSPLYPWMRSQFGGIQSHTTCSNLYAK